MVDSLPSWMDDMGLASRLTLLLLAAVLVSLIVFQFVIAPQRQRTQAFQQTLQALDHQMAEMEQQHGLVEHLNNELDVLSSRIEARKKLLGLHVLVDHLLPDIVGMAQSAGVTLTSWQPGNPTVIPVAQLSQVTLRLEAEGRYHALAHFLESLHTLPKALIVQSMDYQIRQDGAEDSPSDIHASFELTGFQATTSAWIGQRGPGWVTG